MTINWSNRGIGATALLAAPIVSMAMLVQTPSAQALSCSVIADQLSHQNEPLQDAKNRLITCARKYIKYDNTLAYKSKAEWKTLCEADKAAHNALLQNRQTILVRCQPRGSH